MKEVGEVCSVQLDHMAILCIPVFYCCFWASPYDQVVLETGIGL